MVAVVKSEGEGVKARVGEHTSDTSSRDKSAYHIIATEMYTSSHTVHGTL